MKSAELPRHAPRGALRQKSPHICVFPGCGMNSPGSRSFFRRTNFSDHPEYCRLFKFPWNDFFGMSRDEGGYAEHDGSREFSSLRKQWGGDGSGLGLRYREMRKNRQGSSEFFLERNFTVSARLIRLFPLRSHLATVTPYPGCVPGLPYSGSPTPEVLIRSSSSSLLILVKVRRSGSYRRRSPTGIYRVWKLRIMGRRE